jgi:hypothetical protein
MNFVKVLIPDTAWGLKRVPLVGIAVKLSDLSV